MSNASVPAAHHSLAVKPVVLRATVVLRVPIPAVAIRRVLDALHLKHEYVAVHYLGHRDGSYFSKQLAGKKPLTERDIRLLPMEVLERLVDGLRCHLGMPCLLPAAIEVKP